jgi:protease I
VSRTEAHAGVFLFDGFQELEFWYPVLRFREDGIRVTVIGRTDDTTFSRLGYPVVAEVPWSGAPSDCALLVVPGAQPLADSRILEQTTATLRAAVGRGATIAATGDGVGLLGAAGILQSIRVAAPPNTKAALAAQGAAVTELAVCHDRGILTARGADELPEFFRTLLATLNHESL